MHSKKKKKVKTVYIILGVLLCIASAIFMILPPSLGKMPLFYDDNGNVVPGSISEKTYVDVDGTKLGMLITAKDESKPVLLFLGGGPGIPQYLLEHEYPTGLASEFVVCYLEYRGTSISHHKNMLKEDMTTERYLSDIVAVTEYLKDRFHQDKVYLMGHSFGTSLGIEAAYMHPELYHAYIAMAQMTDQNESERIAYQYMLETYESENNINMVKRFEQYPIFSSEEAYLEYSTSSLRDKAMHELGIGTTHNMNSVITGIFLPSLRCNVYTPMERINIWSSRAFIHSAPIGIESSQFNAFDKVPSLSIPVYFLGGIYDYTCCYSLQKEYYQSLNAPLKGFYTFDNSAHSPLYEEPQKAMDILKNDVLGNRNALSD